MSRALELVIFDCDGVLVDSERLAVRIDVQVLATLGWVITEAESRELRSGRSDKSIKADIEAQLGRPLPDDWIRSSSHSYRAAFAAELTALPGVVEALDPDHAADVRRLHRQHDKIRYTLGLTGSTSALRGVSSASTSSRAASRRPTSSSMPPRAWAIRRACAVVEDSRYGVAAARAAGMRAFGFAGGLTPRAWLEAPGTVVFTDMRELPQLLARVGA